jgi:hypothetical protein
MVILRINHFKKLILKIKKGIPIEIIAGLVSLDDLLEKINKIVKVRV